MNFTDLQKGILKVHGRVKSWQKVGAEFGVSKGTACRIAHGHEPKDPRIRRALGLAVMLPAPACVCGRVHVRKGRCPDRTLPEPWEGAVQWLREKESEMMKC